MAYLVPPLNPSYFDPVGPITPEPGTQEDLSGTLVVARFEAAAGYASSSMNAATTYLENLRGVSSGISLDWTPTPITPVEFPPGLSGLTPVDPRNPDVNEIAVAPVEFPYNPPSTDGITQLPVRQIPSFNVALPNFLDPDAPDDEIPDFTTPEPTTSRPFIPARLDEPLPDIPTLTPVTLPDEPTWNTVTFEGIRPDVGDLAAPDNTYVWNEAEYDSDVLAALKVKIHDGIVSGGTGIDPAYEQAIYDRAASRLDIELEEKRTIAESEFAARGSRLPGGALIARLDSLELRDTLAREDLTNDILVKRTDMEFQYSMFIIEKGIALEHELMDYANNMANRAFEAGKLTLEFAFKAFDAAVALRKLRADLYKIEAEVFEAKIRAEIARAELYKSIIEGRKLSISMQELMLSLYEKQLMGISTLIDMRNSTLQGAKIESEINALEIEKFKSLTVAFAERLKGVTAKYDLYQSKLTGDEIKSKIYTSQVGAYGVEVDGIKTAIDADIARLQGELEPIKMDLDIFKGRLGKYEVDIKANVADAEIQAKSEDLKLKVYDGEIKEFTATVDALTKAYMAQSDVNIANIEADLKYGEILTRIEIAKADLDKSIVEAQARIASQLASAALTSVSAGASLQYSQHRSDSTSNSLSNSNSMSKTKSEGRADGLSESHSYAEKCCGD